MEKLDSPVYVTFAVMFPSSWENLSLKIFTSKHNKTEKNPNWIYFVFIQMLLKLAPLYISLCCVVWILWLWWKTTFWFAWSVDSRWCILWVTHLYWPLYCCSLLPFSVCHCTLLHLVVVVNVSLLLCCCTFDALVLSGSTGDKCSLYWNVQALQ